MFENELLGLIENYLLRRLSTAESVSGVRAVIGGRAHTLFCTNDYLGLSGHPAVRSAAMNAIERFGFGSGSAPLIAGWNSFQMRIEEEIAVFKGAQAALVFGSGYLANTGVIPALAREGDLILSDALNHASIIDGCRLSRADVRVYRHCDPGSLGVLLEDADCFERVWVITEGVFSMDGDIAPLPEILAAARSAGATLILDDAHATGTLGRTGRGTLEHFGIPAGGIVQMGTLGKALGSYGAFIAADRDVVDWLVNSARSFMFSTALPPAACAAASAALGLVRNSPELRVRLQQNGLQLRHRLAEMGLCALGDGTPIIPVMVGAASDALAISGGLSEAGFFAPAIRPPTVPEGESRIRFTVSSLHGAEDIDALADALRPLVAR